MIRTLGKNQFLRFGLVGVIGLLVDISVLAALRAANLDPYSARVLSFLAAATATWVLNRSFTFSANRSAGKFAEWLRFISVSTVGGSANYMVYAIVVFCFPDLYAAPTIGVAVGSVFGMFFNFALSRKLVFSAMPRSA